MSDIVKITKQDIVDGIKEDATCCPIALAVERTFTKHYDNLYQKVDWDGYITLRDCDTKEYEFHLEMSNADTNKIRDFVHNFDEGNYVEPFEFKAKVKERRL